MRGRGAGRGAGGDGAGGAGRGRRGPLLLGALGLLVLALASLFAGAGEVTPAGLLSDPQAGFLMLASRLPRALAALLCGASLSVAGLIMQMLVRNRFVEPSTAGTGQSAALGLLAVTLLAPGAPLTLRMAAACLAALLGTAAFLVMIRRLPPTQPLLVPMTGLIWSLVLGAAATFIAWRADLLQYLEIWMNGEFSGVVRGRYELLWLSGLLTAAAYLAADRFTIVGLGRDVSVGLGLNYRRVMALGLAIVSMVTALSVATVGLLPFVGLVAPNLVSRMMGDDLRATLPWAALTGAGMVLACDLAGRLLIRPYEIPAGTMFGVLGAGLFLWLLFAPRAHAR